VNVPVGAIREAAAATTALVNVPPPEVSRTKPETLPVRSLCGWAVATCATISEAKARMTRSIGRFVSERTVKHEFASGILGCMGISGWVWVWVLRKAVGNENFPGTGPPLR
jgi:hypothetical protein